MCGTRHHPELAEVVKTVQEKTTVKLPMGHDGGTGKPSDDWTNQSDHYAFHKAGIPFLYLGVEDHADYHKTTDTFDKFDQGWYLNNCEVALLFLKALDEKAGR
ncbi:MAG: M28 family peptidase [Chitinophagaceae bacterium]|nr:M28 family peptidase [Chitinophagaceae bacterium]